MDFAYDDYTESDIRALSFDNWIEALGVVQEELIELVVARRGRSGGVVTLKGVANDMKLCSYNITDISILWYSVGNICNVVEQESKE